MCEFETERRAALAETAEMMQRVGDMFNSIEKTAKDCAIAAHKVALMIHQMRDDVACRGCEGCKKDA